MGYIGLILLLINLYVCFKDATRGIFLFVFFSLVSPQVILSGISISYNIIAFFPICFVYIIKRHAFGIPSFFIVLIFYFFLLCISTLRSSALNNVRIEYPAIFGAFRFVCLTLILINHKNCNAYYVQKLFFGAIVINLGFSVLQMCFPQFTQLFHDLYSKDSATTLDYYLESGYFNRGVGTFGTPTVLGVFSLLSFCLFYFEFKYGSFQKFKIWGLICSLLCGLLSISKTFLLGIPILFILELLVNIYNTKGRIKMRIHLNKSFIFVLLFLVILGGVVINILIKSGFSILWYLGYLLEPGKALATRYDTNTGILDGLLSVIRENPVIGVGETILPGVFIGDSSYVCILYSVGFGGLFLFLILWVRLLWQLLESGKSYYSHLFLLITLLITFVGSNIFITPLSAIVLAYAADNRKNQPIKV